MSSLEVCEVTKCFGGPLALNRVSCTANLSQIIGLIGPNGAGRAGTLSALSGLLRPR
jgi:ABC-type branched-subunit amino acid transport system ATPase component